MRQITTLKCRGGTKLNIANLQSHCLKVLNFSVCFPLQIEDIVTRIQDETEGVPIRTVKSFMTKIPSVVTGKEWKRDCTVSDLTVMDTAECKH